MALSPAELYAAVRARIGDLVRDAGPVADAQPVPACPGWTVAQLVAHLAGASAALVARDRPGADVTAWVDGHVTARAGQSAAASWAEWERVGAAYERLLERNEAGYGSLLFDAIVHEDDLRAAVGRTPAGDPSALAYGLGRLLRRADGIVRAAGTGTLRLVCAGTVHDIGDGEPVTTWSLPDEWTAVRALASRRSAAQLVALGLDESRRAWLDVLPYPLPVGDLAV